MWDARSPMSGSVPAPIYERRSEHGHVMLCWSPDDLFLLSSAVDNEVPRLRSTPHVYPSTSLFHFYSRNFLATGASRCGSTRHWTAGSTCGCRSRARGSRTTSRGRTTRAPGASSSRAAARNRWRGCPRFRDPPIFFRRPPLHGLRLSGCARLAVARGR